jgi:uncharacterized protein YydD (DUF2326 family)
MKLSRLYSDQPELFTPIVFNGVTNSSINVVFARITKPKDPNKDSHNLGKTTLIHLLDFLLLKHIDKEHIFLKHAALFAKFTFYLEVQTPQGSFVTIKRSARNHNRASLKKHDKSEPDLTGAQENSWDHYDITIDKARQILDGYLSLNSIKPWDYRKGVSYFLRTQEDYRDYFQINKFVKGRDVDWKPYLAHVVGLDPTILQAKYQLDDSIADLEKKRAERQAEVHFDEEGYTKLQARISIQQEEVQRTGQLLDKFDFRQQEERMNRHVVRDVERRIAEINSGLYSIEYDLEQLRSALKTGFSFKIEDVKQIYEEAKSYLPEALYNDYASLLDFNKKLTHERNALMRKQIKEFEAQRDSLTKEAQTLNQERVQLLALLDTEDTFKKFKGLQKEHSQQQAELQYLLAQKERLDKVLAISRDLHQLERERDEQVEKLKDAMVEPTNRTKEIQIEFHRLVQKVLDLTGEFYLRVNQSGNVEFTIDTKLPRSSREVSSQSEGTSYKKLLCALFDLAILRTYSKEAFYHFVYHDGILEGLDVRKRLLVLDVLRESSVSFGIQCIISVIDADLPRDAGDNKIPFPAGEIILDLHDGGPKGRLFKMREF